MSSDQPADEQQPEAAVHQGPGQATEFRNLEAWSRSAPIRLAGYEDDLAEPHILPGVD